MLWLQAASVALISAIAIAVIAKHGWRPDMAQLTLQGVTPEKLRLGLVLAIFSSVGFESATSLGSEARNPLVSIPRAVKWSAILAGVFFFLCAYAEVLAFRGEAQSLGQSPAPLHVLAQKVGLPPIVGTLTDLGAVVTFFSCFLACITAAARVLFLMGRNGALHSVLGEAHADESNPASRRAAEFRRRFSPRRSHDAARDEPVRDLWPDRNSRDIRLRHRLHPGFRRRSVVPALARAA